MIGVFEKMLSKDNLAEIVRFVVVGGISFVIDFGLLIILQELCGLKDVHNGVLISAAVAFTVSLTIHYFLAAFWVFKNNNVEGGKAHARAGALFVVTNVIGLLINEGAMWVGVTILMFHYILVKLFATVIVMVWNYGCQKLFIFKERQVR